MSSKKWCSSCAERVEPNWSLQGDRRKCKEALKWILEQTWNYGRQEEDLVDQAYTQFGVRMTFNCPKCKQNILV